MIPLLGYHFSLHIAIYFYQENVNGLEIFQYFVYRSH